MLHYEVYEECVGNEHRRIPQARFKHLEHANMFCEALKARFGDGSTYVCTVMTDNDHAEDVEDIFKVYCK